LRLSVTELLPALGSGPLRLARRRRRSDTHGLYFNQYTYAGTSLHSALAAAFSVNVQGETDQILLYSMLNIMTCLLIIGILCRVPYVVQPLSNLALNFIGKISYGIYMIHLPLLAIYRGGLRFVWGEEIFAGGVPW